MSTPDADQQSMLALLGSGTDGADTLSVHLNWDINRCLDCLIALEVSGRVLRVSGGYTAVTVVAIHGGPVWRRPGIGGGAGVWGKVLACLLRGTGMALNSGSELHSRWRASQFATSLWAGGVVACPAEGVWGLSCDPFDEGAVLDLLAMKQREVSKGLIVVGASSDVFADVLSDLSSEQRETMLASWPGPNTWLVPHRGWFPSWVTGDSDEVAIRVTSSPALAALCSAFGGPLVSTSANPAGLPPPHSIWELRRYFGTALPAFPGVIDPTGKPSTIRRLEDGSVIRG